MKLSKNDIELLKNVAGITEQAKFKKGKQQRFGNSSIVTQIELENDFPVDFAICDRLTNFLSMVTLVENAELEFKSSEEDEDIRFVTIKNSNAKNRIRFFGSPTELIQDIPQINFKNSDNIQEIELSKSVIDNIITVAKTIGSENIVFINKDKTLMLKACTVEDENYKHFFEVEVGDCDLQDFQIVLDKNKMKFLSSSYILKTDFTSKFVKFESSDYKVEYTIAVNDEYTKF